LTAYALNLRPTTTASSVVHRGITWTFDTSYTVGRFVNGDWYVVDPGSGVTVNSVSPAPSGADSTYRNGSMVNPDPAHVSNGVGYDGRFGSFDAGLAKAFPLALAAGDSLVSTESLTSTPYTNLMGQSVTIPILKRASVLTVLAAAPASASFRPPYVGTTKTAHLWSECDFSFLPSLSLTGSAPTMATYNPLFKGLWLDHIRDWTSRYLHPADNMPDYGIDMAGYGGIAALLLCGTASAVAKRTIAIGLAQLGIDNYYSSLIAQNMWAADGGHMLFRKFPLLFAAKALGKLNSWTISGFSVQEDEQTYHGSTHSETLWTGWAGGVGETSPNVLWRLRSGNDTRSNPWRHEGYAPTAWDDDPPFPNNNDPDHYPFDRLEGYRRTVGQGLVGQVLAARAMGLRTAWNHAPLFDYVDRWMNENDSTSRSSIAAAGVSGAWNTLHPVGGVDWETASTYAPYEGTSTSAFEAEMYAAHRGSVQ